VSRVHRWRYPHQADVYRRTAAASRSEYGSKARPLALVHSGLACCFQRQSGGLERTPAGQAPAERWKGFFSPGSDVRSDDHVFIRGADGAAVVGPAQFRLTGTYAIGGRWDTEADAEVSVERLPAAPVEPPAGAGSGP
jgi:hypothetical protein